MKSSNDTIENRTRDLPACSAVPQPTALPRGAKYLFPERYLTGVIGLDLAFRWLKIVVLRTAEAVQWVNKGIQL